MPFFKRKSDKKNSPPPSLRLHSASQRAVQRSSLSRSLSRSPDGSVTSNGDLGLPYNQLDPFSGGTRPRTLPLRVDFLQELDGDLGDISKPLDSPMRTSSRLSKTLQEILHDKDALPYLIQFMESRDAVHFVKFWLDAKSFQTAAWTRIRTHSLNTLSKSLLVEKSSQTSGRLKHKANDSSPLHSLDPSSTTFRDSLTLGQQLSGQSSVDIENGKESFHQSVNNTETNSQISYSYYRLPSQYAIIPDQQGMVESESSCSKDCVTMLKEADNQDGSSEIGRNTGSIGKKLLSSIEKDAVSIYSKYISLDAVQPIRISDELRNETTSKICQEDGHVDPQCFVGCQEHVLEIMEREYFQDFLQSVFHCKHQIDILTSGKVYLADILYNDSAMFYFMEFMEQEDAINLLQFWLAAENFQQHLASFHGCYDGMQAQSDAMVLYEKYFSLQATQPLGFEDKVRLEVESNICREGGPLPDCFAKPKNMVLKVIEKVFFSTFLQHDLYYKFLSELVNTVQLAQDLPQRRRRLGSDASSEHSIGSQSTGESVSARNTLLAMDTRKLKKALNKIDADLSIDSVLLNPDALWKRPNTGKMSFGKIDELGQFVSEYDPEPEHEKKRGSRFFRKKKDKEKQQEELALQIAQMIVKGVTSITQNNDPSTSLEQT